MYKVFIRYWKDTCWKDELVELPFSPFPGLVLRSRKGRLEIRKIEYILDTKSFICTCILERENDCISK